MIREDRDKNNILRAEPGFVMTVLAVLILLIAAVCIKVRGAEDGCGWIQPM